MVPPNGDPPQHGPGEDYLQMCSLILQIFALRVLTNNNCLEFTGSWHPRIPGKFNLPRKQILPFLFHR